MVGVPHPSGILAAGIYKSSLRPSLSVGADRLSKGWKSAILAMAYRSVDDYSRPCASCHSGFWRPGLQVQHFDDAFHVGGAHAHFGGHFRGSRSLVERLEERHLGNGVSLSG
jgi:hypothetical protein